jgi:uncharacterized delta-60 repeat protein
MYFMKNYRHYMKRLAIHVARFSHRLFVVSIAALFICWAYPLSAQASAGELDSTFGSGGKVTTNFFNIPGVFFPDRASALAVQSDGKIVAVGVAQGLETNFRPNFAIVRYKSDGSLDSGFGSGGKVVTDFFDNGASAFAVAIQPDNKIIAAGGASGSFALARYNTNGSLDMTFGTSGKVTTSFFNNSEAIATAIALQSDGKIVVAGSAISPITTYDFAVARYNTDGALDSSFGSGGKVTTDFFGKADQALSVALQVDGKIVAAGLALNITRDDDFALTRYNTDGTPDSGFGSGGKVTTDIAGLFDIAHALALQADGKIVVVGDAAALPQSGGVLIRYNPNGSLDTTFGSSGKIFSNFLGNANDVAIQPGEKIIVAGVAGEFGNFDFGLMRFNSNGSPDSTFGIDGKVTTDFFGGDDRAFAIALQSDGKIVLAGAAFDIVTFNESFALARYNGDGASFDLCIQDDSNGNIFKLNSTTADYQFTNCSGFTLGGTGTLIKRESMITLQHTSSDRRVTVTINAGTHRATASLQVFSQGKTFSITDRNTLNNSCACN